MKHSKLILLALVGLFFFTSCKDDDPVKPVVTTPTFATITKIKALTSVSITTAQTTIEGWGYSSQGSTQLDQGVKLYTFTSDTKTDVYMLYVTNNVVFGSSYSNLLERTMALKGFEDFSKECIAYMSGKTSLYSGQTTLDLNNTTSFTSHDSFASHYLANTYDISSCHESWKTVKELVKSSFSAQGTTGTIKRSELMYIDVEIMPEGFM